MGSLLENLQKRGLIPTMPYQDDLPTFRSQQQRDDDALRLIGLRKRISASSFSAKIQPPSSASVEWALRRSKSVPSVVGDLALGAAVPLRRWWHSWWGWILSRKPASAEDVEMDERDGKGIGWRHILCRLRSEIRKLVLRSNSLPTTYSEAFRCDSFTYAHDFDQGKQEGY